MQTTLQARPLTREAFAPYGDVIDAATAPDFWINQDRAARHHDLARLDFGPAPGRAGLSLVVSEPVDLPVQLAMMERHPLGSQAFVPLNPARFLVIVAADKAGRPHDPQAFITAPGAGVNYHRNAWHGVLMPLGARQQFAVIDRVGGEENLQEHWFDDAICVMIP